MVLNIFYRGGKSPEALSIQQKFSSLQLYTKLESTSQVASRPQDDYSAYRLLWNEGFDPVSPSGLQRYFEDHRWW